MAVPTADLKLALVQVNSNSEMSPQLLDVDPRVSGLIQFTPHGDAIAYTVKDRGVDNVWIQPLDGSKRRLITHFSSGSIRSFHWSPNGKRLALVRLEFTSDVILFNDTGTQAQ